MECGEGAGWGGGVHMCMPEKVAAVFCFCAVTACGKVLVGGDDTSSNLAAVKCASTAMCTCACVG